MGFSDNFCNSERAEALGIKFERRAAGLDVLAG